MRDQALANETIMELNIQESKMLETDYQEAYNCGDDTFSSVTFWLKYTKWYYFTHLHKYQDMQRLSHEEFSSTDKAKRPFLTCL